MQLLRTPFLKALGRRKVAKSVPLGSRCQETSLALTGNICNAGDEKCWNRSDEGTRTVNWVERCPQERAATGESVSFERRRDDSRGALASPTLFYSRSAEHQPWTAYSKPPRVVGFSNGHHLFHPYTDRVTSPFYLSRKLLEYTSALICGIFGGRLLQLQALNNQVPVTLS